MTLQGRYIHFTRTLPARYTNVARSLPGPYCKILIKCDYILRKHTPATKYMSRVSRTVDFLESKTTKPQRRGGGRALGSWGVGCIGVEGGRFKRGIGLTYASMITNLSGVLNFHGDRLLPKPGTLENWFSAEFLYILYFITINETHNQCSLSDTLFNYNISKETSIRKHETLLHACRRSSVSGELKY